MSPVGLPSPPEGYDQKKRIEMMKKRGMRFKVAATAWENNWSMWSILRAMGYYGAKNVLGRFVGRRCNIKNEDEKAAMTEILVQTAMRNKSSEVCITMILMSGALARYPCGERIPELKMPVGFMYGKSDWMTKSHAEKLLDRLDQKSKVYVVKNAGHQLMINNPLECCRNLCEFVGDAEMANLFDMMWSAEYMPEGESPAY